MDMHPSVIIVSFPFSGMSMPTDMLRHLGYMSNVHGDKQLSILVYIDHQPITMHDLSPWWQMISIVT